MLISDVLSVLCGRRVRSRIFYRSDLRTCKRHKKTIRTNNYRVFGATKYFTRSAASREFLDNPFRRVNVSRDRYEIPIIRTKLHVYPRPRFLQSDNRIWRMRTFVVTAAMI